MTNGLYGSYRLDGVVAVIYGVHLTHDRHAERAVVDSRPAGTAAMRHCWQRRCSRFSYSCIGTAIASLSPQVAQFTWCLAFSRAVRRLACRTARKLANDLRARVHLSNLLASSAITRSSLA